MKLIERGFTLVELITVIVLMGVLAAIALPRFSERTEFDARGFFDQTVSTLRYAQKTAIAQRRDVFVQIDQSTGNICLTYVAVDANCTSNVNTSPNAVLDPSDLTWIKRKAPAGVSFGASSSFRFTPIGRPNPNISQTIVINGGGTIVVERETGYVR